MKKILLLLTIMVTLCTYGWAQLGVGQQMQNNNLESWSNESGTSILAPNNWHTMNAATGGLASMASSSDFVTRISESPGGSGSYCVQLKSTSKVGVVANGGITSGCFNADAMSAGNSKNCTYTSASGFHMNFSAYPDSVYVWTKTELSSGNSKAQFNIVLHNGTAASGASNGAIYQDPTPTATTGFLNNHTEQENSVVNTTSAVNEAKAVAKAKAMFNTSGNWVQQKVAFTYTSNSSAPIYVLATFSTNKDAGGGSSGDKLIFDDVVFIYNTRLATLKVNGSDLAGFNPDVTDYNYPTTIPCSGSAPTVTGTCQSAHASTQIMHTPTLAEPYTTIRVKHLNQESTVYKDYTIHYTYESIAITLNSPDNTYTACAGDPITVTASGASTYQWSGGLGSGATVHPTVSGTYTVTGTNASGCSGTAVAYVTVNPAPSVTINGNTSICSGASTTLTAGGASTYQWSNNSTATSINVSTGGTYTVTGTANGCSATASVTVTEHAAPVVTISGPTSNTVCAGTPVTLTADGANTYVWSDGLGNTASVNPPTATAGNKTYTVTGTDSHNCTGTATYQLNVNQTPTVSITSNITAICNGVSQTLTASCTPSTATLTWTGGTTGSSLMIDHGGEYSVTANLSGCESTASVTVTEAATPAQPTVTPGSRCGSGSVTLTAQGESGTTLNWYASENATNPVGTGGSFNTPNLTASTTTYYVSAQYDGGCASPRVPVTATILEKPAAPTVTSVSSCGETDITLTAANVGSNTLKWYSDPAGENEITNLNQHVTSTTAFYAANVAANGCRSNLQPLTVTIKSIPTEPTATSPAPFCSNDIVNVTLSATVPSGHVLRWYDESHGFLFQGSQTVSLSESTTYYATSYNQNTQCESDFTAFNVVINPLPNAPVVEDESICGGGNITLTASSTNNVTWYASETSTTSIPTQQHIEETTTFYVEATDANNCHSSRAAKTVTVKPNYSNIIDNQTACGSYTWEDSTYTVSGNYTKTLNSSLGCDSVVTLSLTINNGYTFEFDTTVCDQFVWQGDVITTSQTVIKQLFSQEGCDSTVTYNVTVHHNSASTQSLTLCSSEVPYDFLGTSISTSGTYTVHTTNAENCDSTITLNVTILQPVGAPTITSTTLTRCGAGSISLNVAKGTNSEGCHWYTVETGGESFLTGNSYQPELEETTTYYVASYNNIGCEGPRTTVTATINPVPAEPQVSPVSRCGAGEVTLNATSDENATTCRWYLNNNPGAPLQYSGFEYTRNISGNTTLFVESYNATTECKSARTSVVATVNLIPTAPQVTSTEHCGTLTADLATFVTSSTDMLRWYDSNENLLSENAHYTPTVSETTTYRVSNYNSETTCESPKQSMTVTIYPTYAPQNIYDTVCQHTVYNQYGIQQTFDATGEFNFTLNTLSSTGCDSSVTLHVLVKPVITNTISATDCDSYVWAGTTYTQSGSYQKTFTAANDCDSIVTLNLTIHNSIATEFSAAQCDSYTWNDQTYTQSGNYTQTFTSADNCDSTVTLHLTIYPSYQHEFEVSACVEYVWNNMSYQNSGDFTQTFETVHGCDSTVTMHLTIHEPVVLNFEGEVCAGTTYSEYGFDTTFTQPNVYHLTHFGQTLYGCDSTTNLTLTVHPTYNQSIQKMICENSSFVFNGQTLTEPGVYTANLQTVHGCDSIVTLNLSVGSQFRDTITAHICAGESYHQHNFDIDQPTATLYDSLSLIASNGCDSLSVLHLIVHYPDTSHLYTTLCQDESYRQHGFNVTLHEAGDTTLVRHTTTPYGCDSTIMVHITVNPKSVITLYDTVCAETSYERYGFNENYETAGNHTLVNNGQNQYLCDSTTTLHLTVLPTYHLTINQTACESYTWNDQTYNESGEYTQNLSSVHGCDSIVTMLLTILQPDTTMLADTACGSFTWNNETYEQSGVYTQTLQNVHHCDSVVILDLVILPTSASEFDTTVCAEFTWNDTTYYQSGVYTQHFENILGCDSAVTLHLTINPTDTVHISHIACVSYTWNDQTYDETGDYTQYFENVFGCDSTVILHLTINQSLATDEHITICDNELPYTYGDTVFEVGTPALSVVQYHFTSTSGCDSTVTLYLTVNPTYSIDTTVNICENLVPFIWNDNDLYSYIESGDYDIPFQTVNGCDSIIHLHLNVNPTYVQDTTVSVCQGALPYHFDESHVFNQTGIYTVNLLTASGCDSIWNLHLTVTPNAEHTFSQTICDSELPFTYMEQQFESAGEYDITETDDDNCLSITHFTLIVNPTYHSYDTVIVCQEALPYTYGSTTMTESGDYDIHFPAANTCDSLISVHFTVIPTAQGVDELFVCASDFPVVYGGSSFSAEGVYPITFHRDGLCDSIVTLTIHQAQEYLITETDNVCDHELPYLWRGMSLTETGVYTDSLVSFYGCDSVYRLQLTVNETQLIVNNPIVLCQGETQDWRGMTLSESGIYRDTITSAITGCREIHEVTVTVNPTYLFHDTVTICSDELPYQWHGMTLNEAGFREDYNQTANLCDSIYRLTLIVNPSYHVTNTATVCDYDLPYLWHGQSLTESGSYYDTMTTVNGCDSTFALTLTVNPSSHVTTSDTVCNTMLPYSWRGYLIPAAGTYFDTVSNAFGCNDVYELQLTVNQSNTITIYDTICQGGYYTQNGFDTLASASGTVYAQLTLTNANGCDSIVNLVLNVLPTYFFETTAETCENVPFAWHGGEFVAAGTYYDSLTTANGCDSVYVLHLTVNPTYEVFVSDSAINGHEYQYDNFVVTPSDSGTFHYDIQYYTVANCDSVVHLTLIVAFNDGIEEFEMTPEFSFFPNPTQAVLNIAGERMSRIHVYDLSGRLVLIADPDTPEQARLNVTGFATGHYVVKVLLKDGKTVTGKIIVDRR